MHDLFFNRTDGYQASRLDEINQGPIDDNIVSEIVGTKHGDAVVRNPSASKVESVQ